MSSTIIYGPQGCGKTRNAKALAEHFGAKHIVDSASIEQIKYADQVESTLFLTNCHQAIQYGAIEFSSIAKELG
jgi:replication-associated recombination protein RarA